jgi:Ni/Fe-hydrogenase subunit HybB-like protein
MAMREGVLGTRELSDARPLSLAGVFVPVVLVGLMALAFAVAIVRYVAGIGAISNLNDAYGWGLWISFDLLCGVALAAGAFVTATAVYIFGIERFRPILRPAILTGFLGYLMVVIALMVDLGRPERIWYMIIHWNLDSVMFEVGWCVMLYTGVLALEFSPMLWERLRLEPFRRIIEMLVIPLVILGTTLSTLHQSSLGSLFTIAPDQLHKLWYTPLLPLMFWLTAVAVGPAMVILESTISSKVFKRGLETDLVAGLAKVIPVALFVYLGVKIGELVATSELGLAFEGDLEGNLFLGEIIGGVIAPMVLFSLPAVRRSNGLLLLSAMLVIGGVVMNRFDVSLVGLARPEGVGYFPNWMEFVVTIGIVAAGVTAFGLVARNLPLFGEHAHGEVR